jgi:1-deoxy-D-xylulose-5-phosphate reductoisomerase
VASLDLCKIGHLDFEPPDMTRFPCLALAYQALRQGGNAPAVLNAANEIAVEAFLQRKLPFPNIASVIVSALESVPSAALPDLAAVMAADQASRAAAREALRRYSA